jgi:hypothetical protein
MVSAWVQQRLKAFHEKAGLILDFDGFGAK